MVTNITEILNQLSDLSIYLFVEDGKLKTRSAKGVLTPEVVALIKGNKDELLTYLLAQENLSENTPITARGLESAPLSFAQQRLWMVDSIDGGSPQFNMLNCLRLVGDVDIVALEYTFNNIVDRHQILRTNFIKQDTGTFTNTEAMQVVQESLHQGVDPNRATRRQRT